MRTIRFQNQVAASIYTLPVALLVTTLLWFAKGPYTLPHILSWLLALLTTLMWWKTCRQHALIRVRSYLTPAICFLLFGCTRILHTDPSALFAAFCGVLSFHFLAASYQQRQASRPLFHAFLFLSLGSLVQPKTLWFTPLYVWHSIYMLQSLHIRSFSGALMGWLLPFWLLFGYALLTSDYSFFVGYYNELTAFGGPSAAQEFSQSPSIYVLLGWVLTVATVAATHCIRSGFNEKIRTRLLLYILILQAIATLFFLLLFPSATHCWLAMLLSYSAMMSGHYFSLTHQRFSNHLFIISLCILTSIALFNLWIP